jgi:ribosomal protein S27AE
MQQDELIADIERRAHARSRVLAALQSGPVDSAALNAICYRYGARIMELRRAGWPIAAKREGKVLWRYELTGDEEPKKASKTSGKCCGRKRTSRFCPDCGASLMAGDGS